MANANDFPDEGGCPMLGKCVKHKCPWYIHLLGTNPQSGATEDKWGCSIAFIPILLIENSKMQRETGAAVESMRNEQALDAQRIRAGFEAIARVAASAKAEHLLGATGAKPDGG